MVEIAYNEIRDDLLGISECENGVCMIPQSDSNDDDIIASGDIPEHPSSGESPKPSNDSIHALSPIEFE